MTSTGLNTVPEACEKLGVCLRTLRKMIKLGTIKVYRPVLRKTMIRDCDIAEFIQRKTR